MGPVPAALEAWLRSVVVVLCEIETGRRSPRAAWPILHRQLRSDLAGRPRRGGRPAEVLRIRGQRQATGWQVVVLLSDAGQVRALGIEVRVVDSKPYVHALAWPEDAVGPGSLPSVGDDDDEPGRGRPRPAVA